MADPRSTDGTFEGLLRARSLGALTAAERTAMAAIAATDAARAAAIAEVDAVLAAFAGERDLAAAVAAPTEPAEEADPTFARLQATAAAAGDALRARCLHPAALAPALHGIARRAPWRRRAGLLLVAAAGLALWLLGSALRGTGAGLDTRTPADLRAGGRLQLILLEPTLAADARRIAWAATPGADGYDAAILDAGGAVVLRRPADLRKSTAWEPTAEQFALLAARTPLRLRVTALDGSGIPIGSSGDLPLGVR